MKVLRTPDGRFADLPDFGYPPRYGDVDGLRLAYVEVGPADGEPILLLHGEPSWSFLYRKVMPVLADAGLRAIAADLVGFGRSDKPSEVGDHSFARHVEWIRALAFDHLGLRGLTLVGQDWGGLIGLRLVAEHPDRFARVVAANTGLPTGDLPMPDVWLRFREVVRTAPALSVSRLVQSGCQTTLPADVLAAYEAPFPDPSYAAAVRAMPDLVPATPDNPASAANRAAWQRLAAWDKPFLVAFSDRDPITGAMAPVLKRAVPGAAGREHPVLAGAGHFLQEDAGEELGAVIAEFVRTLPGRGGGRRHAELVALGVGERDPGVGTLSAVVQEFRPAREQARYRALEVVGADAHVQVQPVLDRLGLRDQLEQHPWRALRAIGVADGRPFLPDERPVMQLRVAVGGVPGADHLPDERLVLWLHLPAERLRPPVRQHVRVRAVHRHLELVRHRGSLPRGVCPRNANGDRGHSPSSIAVSAGRPAPCRGGGHL